MSIDECHEFVSQMSFGRLGCARDHQPYVVPIYFAWGGKHLYCFSMLGQKIEWMRANPRVCVEVDEVVNQQEWKSVVVMGSYEELGDGPSGLSKREYALQLLQNRVMWWRPAYVTTQHRGSQDHLTPVFYRILIEKISGHRGMRDSLEQTNAPANLGSEIKQSSRWH